MTDKNIMDRALSDKERRKLMIKKACKWTVPAVLLIAIAYWIGVLAIPTIDRKSILASEVKRGTIETSISATGIVVPAFEEIISSPIGSKIMEVYAHCGDSVDIGTPLLRLDLESANNDYSKQLDEWKIRQQQLKQLKLNTETQLSNSKMQLEIEKMQLAQLETQYRNELFLDSLGSSTRERIQQAEIALRIEQMKYKQMCQQYENDKKIKQADILTQQLQNNIFGKGLSETRRTLDGANIRATRKAILTYIYNEIGGQVNPGSKIAVISDLSRFKLQCNISDSYSDKIIAGGAVRVKIGKERLTGIISSVSPKSESNLTNFTVSLDNPGHSALHSGIKLDVSVVTDIRKDVLTIRNSSYYNGKGKYTMFVYKDDNTLVPRTINLGESNDEYVEVINGLEEGEKVIISDMTKYSSAKKIKIE